MARNFWEMEDNMATNYWDMYASLVNSPEFQAYLKAGRVTLPSGSNKQIYDSVATQLGTVKAQDKQIGQYYEFATGKKADQSTIDKYVQYANDPALLSAAIGKEATLAPATGQYKDTIKSTVQDKLGRAPTEAELGYFGKQMEAGNLDAYGLQDFLGGTSEYQSKYADTARTKLAGELGAVDTDYLNKVQSALESKYAAAGRSGSSAFGSALIGAGKDLATNRTAYLADIGYNSALAGQDNLKAAYQNRLSQMYANQQGTAAAGSESRQRYYSQMDYDRAAVAQERLRKLSQPRSQSFLQSVAPGVIQAGIEVGGNALLPGAGTVAKQITNPYFSRSSLNQYNPTDSINYSRNPYG